MSAHAAIGFQKHNPAVVGLATGIVLRAAWEIGFLPSIALMLRDAGVVIWIMMNDVFSACWAFWQFVIR